MRMQIPIVSDNPNYTGMANVDSTTLKEYSDGYHPVIDTLGNTGKARIQFNPFLNRYEVYAIMDQPIKYYRRNFWQRLGYVLFGS